MRSTINATALAIASIAILTCQTWGSTLQDVLDRGELRHLGVPYAKFVTGAGDGLDVELMKRFADHLGVTYSYVQSDWDNVIPDLIGKELSVVQGKALLGEKRPIRGDIIASGLTVLDWREELLLLSSPTFPTQVWLLAASRHPYRPVEPSGSISTDIERTRDMVKNSTVMGLKDTCLDPFLYDLDKKGGKIVYFDGETNDLVPAMIKGVSDLLLLDVPDFLASLSSWQGRIKVLGPITETQTMAVAFSPEGEKLKDSFELFFAELIEKGEYREMVTKYYPGLFNHFPLFLSNRN